MDNNDIQMLKDCIMFVIENDTDLDEQDVKNLWNLNSKLLLSDTPVDNNNSTHTYSLNVNESITFPCSSS